MTPKEINIAIAKLLGWEFVPSHDRQGVALPERWLNPDGFEFFEDPPFPNFYADLNACHEMEKALRVDQLETYLRFLVPNEQQWIKYAMNAYWLITHATAPQRCEAFLKTFGDWKE